MNVPDLAHCRLCGSVRIGDHFQMEDATGVPVSLGHCFDCDAVSAAFSSDRITTCDEIAHQIVHHEKLWGESRSDELASVVSDLREMIRQMCHSFGEAEPGNLVVELGAGRGSLLKALQTEGYSAIGCEPSAVLVELAQREYELSTDVLSHMDAASFLALLAKSQPQPRVIVLWHVLEHMAQPRSILSDAYELLQPGGRILAQVPMLASEYIFPEHLFFPSSTSFRRLTAAMRDASVRTWADDENLYLTVEIIKMKSTDGEKPPATVTGEIFIESLAARRRETARLHQKVREAQERITTMEARIANLVSPASTAAANSNPLTSADPPMARRGKASLSIRLEHAKAEIANQTARIAAIKRELEERHLAVQTLETQNSGLESNLEVVRRRFARSDDALRDAQGRLAKEVDKTRSLQERLAEVESDGASLAEQIIALQARASEQEKLLHDCRAELNTLIEQTSVRNIEHAEEIEARTRRESEQSVEITRLGSLLVTSQEQAEALCRELDASTKEHVREHDRLSAITASLEQTNAEQLTVMQRDLLRYRSLEQLVARLEQDRDERDQLLSRTRSNFEDLVSCVREAERTFPARVGRQLGWLKSIKLANDIPILSEEKTEMSSLRSLEFTDRSHNRYWWHRLERSAYVPLLYSSMTEREWALMDAWFTDTEQKYSSTGEANIPPLSMLMGLISGNGISRVVQCGHYVGYSTLVLGFLLRRQNTRRSLFSIDIDAEVTRYTQEWVDRAGLDDIVHLHIGDSASDEALAKAIDYLCGRPELIFIDSSHQYEHSLRELDAWYEQLVDGGFLLLHDTSEFAASFDGSHKGGVLQAVREWCASRSINSLAINSFVAGGSPGDFPYLDGCGITLIQKTPK